MFGELPVLSNTVLIITVCVKVANSTFLVTNNDDLRIYTHFVVIYSTILQVVCVFDGENFWTDIKLCFLVSELIRLSI